MEKQIGLQRFEEILVTVNPKVVKEIKIKCGDKDNKGYCYWYDVEIGTNTYKIWTGSETEIYMIDLNEALLKILEKCDIPKKFID